MATEERLREWRCYQCGRLLAKFKLTANSIVEIKCRCGAYNVWQVGLVTDNHIDSKKISVV